MIENYVDDIHFYRTCFIVDSLLFYTEHEYSSIAHLKNQFQGTVTRRLKLYQCRVKYGRIKVNEKWINGIWFSKYDAIL